MANTSAFVASELPPSQPVVISTKPIDSTSTRSSPLRAQETYDGGYKGDHPVRLRLGNGGAGQAGLIGAFANAFIQWRVEICHDQAFKVEWYLGDTTQSLSYLSLGYIDVAFTYNQAAELSEVKSGVASRRDLIFTDHFYLVGPPANPADLNENDSVSDMFNKIVGTGNRDAIVPPPADRPPTRFLSRFDKSATNIKESEMFIKIGQVPWALAYSSWYHQYPRFPLQALAAASQLAEYTLTDRGTWLSSPSSVTAETSLRIYAKGSSEPTPEGSGESDAKSLLNPCNALLSSMPGDPLATTFMDWLLAPEGGQKVVRNFKKFDQVLYTPAVGA
ncbi:hypothetical protein HGRIS_013753 [Hohenbuehelia grisea]|uniref:PBP domain-containing protein n=1 Tax=Hohenbuehelia grisea TaxID=104357 RepID=A0ABR3IWI8_9AGAR